MVQFNNISMNKESSNVDLSAKDGNNNNSNKLPPDFSPGNWDVICQRGKECFDHVGNQRFRLCIEDHIDEYTKVSSRLEKSFIVSKIVEVIRANAARSGGSGFVRKDLLLKRWFSVGDKVAREKVGQALRDAIKTKRTSGKTVSPIDPSMTSTSDDGLAIIGWRGEPANNQDRPVSLDAYLPYNTMALKPIFDYPGNTSATGKRKFLEIEQSWESLRSDHMMSTDGTQVAPTFCFGESPNSKTQGPALPRSLDKFARISEITPPYGTDEFLKHDFRSPEPTETRYGATPGRFGSTTNYTDANVRGDTQNFLEGDQASGIGGHPREQLPCHQAKKRRSSLSQNGTAVRRFSFSSHVDVLLNIFPISSFGDHEQTQQAHTKRRLSDISCGGEMSWPKSFHPISAGRDAEDFDHLQLEDEARSSFDLVASDTAWT